jgi:DNA-binding winged helix-turn-helix (wHTH) protein/Tol biopolymer transport system component
MASVAPPDRDAIAAQPEPITADPVEFAAFRMEIARRKLWRGDELITLPPKAFDMLVALASAGGRVVEKKELMHRLWPDTFVSEESITQCVSALRKALGDDSSRPQFIATVPRRGYRLVPPIAASASPLTVAGEIEQSGSAETVARFPAPRAVVPAEVHDVPHRRTRAVTAAAIVAAVLIVGAVVFALWPATRVAPATTLRFVEDAPAGSTLVSGGLLSPDGRSIAYLARHNDTRVTTLWVRLLNGTAPRQLPGTAGAVRPFWSPDNKAIGFFADGRLRTIDLSSGAVQTLATVGPMPVGGAWSSGGVIIFADRRSNLLGVSVNGGKTWPVTRLNREAAESAHRTPYFLPDGDHFLYYANSANPDRTGTFLTSLSGAPPVRLLDASSGSTVYAEPGYLLHISNGQLLANAFDLATATVNDEPIVLATGVSSPLVTNAIVLSASATGLLAYGGGTARSRLAWFDAEGHKLSSVDAPAELHNPVITADDRSVLASSLDAERRGIWIVDNARGTANWLVREGISPMPTRDGQTLSFTSNRGSGIADIYTQPFAGTGSRLLLKSEEPKAITDWSDDGRYLVYTSSNATTKEDMWILPLSGSPVPMAFLNSPYNEMQGEVAPNGRWIAYTSDESGRWEVYLQSFPNKGLKRVISTTGGAEPHWRKDGKRLYFLAVDQRIMAVDVDGDDQPRIGRPERLFQVPVSSDLPTTYRNQFAVTGDGKRFVVDVVDEPSKPITVVVNWTAALPAR